MNRACARSLSACCLIAVAAWGTVACLGDEPYGRFQFSPAELDHWAYKPVRRCEPPAVVDIAWARNPIDAFVLTELEHAELEPAPPADRRSLLRRVYFDLIGLPPALEEQQRFLSDLRPDAYARLVDELLARPEYGERWGRHWLDVVRYAESNGYERDGAKPSVWRYRDWVIEAFNRDMPYDQFIREQLAGDELPDSNAERQIATTFLRLGPWDDEPADPLVDRYDQLDDLVGATTAVFMSQTVRCARCHDHKFEMFSQRDYSRLLAVFEPLKRPQDGRADLDCHVGTADELAAYRGVVERLETQLTALRKLENESEVDICRRLTAAGVLPPPPTPLAATSRWEPQNWHYTVVEPGDDWFTPLYDDSGWQKGPGGFGTKGTPGTFVRTIWDREHIWLRRHFELSDDSLSPEQLAKLRLLIHHDDEAEIYLNGILAAQVGGFLVDYQALPISAAALAALKPGDNVLAVHCHQTTGGQYIDVGIDAGDPMTSATDESPLPPDALAAFLAAPESRSKQQHSLVKKHRSQLRQLIMKAASVEEQANVEGLRRQIEDIEAQRPAEPTKAYIWTETTANLSATHVFHRGDPRDQRAEVGPGAPAILVSGPLPPPMPTGHSSGRRRQLADWLACADNPLTARVMANRVWQHHFGDGLVGSENDFGLMGEAPTHPELLDWLASEFVARGWSVKHLHRLILLSNAYQMSAAPNEAAEDKDPNCDLLWHFAPRRLEAEAIRDAVLSTSGLLNRQRGGESVYPVISPGVLASQSRPGNGWGKSTPEQAARRSVYVFVKRTLPLPELEVLDFPDTNSSCEQRQVSTVAPQALTLLNGDFMQENARQFAKRLIAEVADTPERIERAYLLALARPPSDAERAAVLDFLGRQAEQIRRDANDASRDEVSAAERALEAFCLVLLNTNEFAYQK